METYQSTINVKVDTEDILELLYSIYKAMPDKKFLDIMQLFEPIKYDSSDVEVYKYIKGFIKDNNIEETESPQVTLDMLELQILEDLDLITSNLQYCMKSGRYMEAEKEIAYHQCLNEILKIIRKEE